MCTHPSGRGTLFARDIEIGGIYRTTIAKGVVVAYVACELPRQPKARNKLFLLVDIVTNMPLPRPKRAEDLERDTSPFFTRVVLPPQPEA